MDKYAILRFEKLKSIDEIRRSLAHNFRAQPTPNADPALLHTNTHYGPTSVQAGLDAIKAKLPSKLRKNGVLALEFLVTSSPEAMAAKSRPQQDAYFADALGWLRTRHGADNLVVASVHRDETTAHLSAIVIPFDPRGHLNARHFSGDKAKLQAMQTAFASEIGEKHGLERGVPGSGATHVSIRKYYESVRKAEKGAVDVQTILSTQHDVSIVGRAKGEVSQEIWNTVQSVPALQAEVARLNGENKRLKQNIGNLTKERAKAEAAEVRDLPLATVLTRLGAKRDPAAKTLWMSPRGPIQTYPANSKKFTITDEKRSGRGAIDLVMAMDGRSFEDAVSWLMAHHGDATADEIVHEAAKAAAEAVEARARAVVAQPASPPPVLDVEHVGGALEAVRRSLAKHNLALALSIDSDIRAGTVGAATVGEAVHAAFALGGSDGQAPSGWHLASIQTGFEAVRGRAAPYVLKVERAVGATSVETLALFTESPLDAYAIRTAFATGRIARRFARLIVVATCGISYDGLRRVVRDAACDARALVAAFVRDDHGRTMSGHLTRAIREEGIEPDNRGYMQPPFPNECARWIEALRRAKEWWDLIAAEDQKELKRAERRRAATEAERERRTRDGYGR